MVACNLETETLDGSAFNEQLKVNYGGVVAAVLNIAPRGCDRPGIVLLDGHPDLSAVLIGDVFIDERAQAFVINSINDAAKQLEINGTCVALDSVTALAMIQRSSLLVTGGNVGIGTEVPGATLHVRENDTVGPVAQLEGDGSGDDDRRVTLVLRNTDANSASGRISFLDAAGAGRWEVVSDTSMDGTQTFGIFDVIAQTHRLHIDPVGRISGLGPLYLYDFGSVSSQRSSLNSYTNLFLGGGIHYQGDGTYVVHGDGGSNYWAAIKMDNGVGPNLGTIDFLTRGSIGGNSYTLTDAELGVYRRMRVTSTGLQVLGNITATGSITPGSSRTLKRDIHDLAAADALAALAKLRAVRFRYRADPADEHLGFIAEDVPALVATADRRGVDPSDIVAVLTVVIQSQQQHLAAQGRRLDEIERRLEQCITQHR